MNLFRRFANIIGRKDRLHSVAVYLRADKYFVVTIHGCDGGDPCISAGPVESLPAASTHEELGAAILRGLQRTTHHYRYPANKEQWAQVTAPLFSAVGCKTWNAFAKIASYVRVDQAGAQIQLLPGIREKSAFAPVAERERSLAAPSAQELGAAVADELSFAAARDGA